MLIQPGMYRNANFSSAEYVFWTGIVSINGSLLNILTLGNEVASGADVVRERDARNGSDTRLHVSLRLTFCTHDKLDTRAPVPDDSHTLALKINASVPVEVVELVASKRLATRNRGDDRLREGSRCRHDDVGNEIGLDARRRVVDVHRVCLGGLRPLGGDVRRV